MALLEGHLAPVAIRPGAMDRWRLVGDCYVHGIMKGEAFDKEQSSYMWFE